MTEPKYRVKATLNVNALLLAIVRELPAWPYGPTLQGAFCLWSRWEQRRYVERRCA